MTASMDPEARLRILINAYADRAPVAVDAMDVARLAAARSGRRTLSVAGPNTPRPSLAYVLLVIALVASLAGAAVVGAQLAFREADPVPGMRVLVEPFPGLPPESAPPSMPETGEVVLSFNARVKGLRSDVYSMQVYADGRLLWRRSLENARLDTVGAFGLQEPTTAVIEQRLSPAGIQALLDEVRTPGELVGERWGHGPGVVWGNLQVRIGGSMTSLHWTNESLPERLADPAAWLPPNAWLDRRIGAFVPSRYAVGITDNDLSQLPASVREVLLANGVRADAIGHILPESAAVTTETARRIATVLEREGRRTDAPFAPPGPNPPGRGRPIGAESPKPMGGLWFTFGPLEGTVISLEPMLPDGSVVDFWTG